MVISKLRAPKPDPSLNDMAELATRRFSLDAYALTIATISSAAAGMLSYVIAARLFPQAAVGRAAAITSAMLLISGISQLDLTNALHRFLPGSGRSAKKLIIGSYLLTTLVSVILGGLFVAVFGKPIFGDHRLAATFWFAGSVAIWSLFNLQDQVLTGLGKAMLVPLDYGAFGVARIALLVAVVGSGAYAIFLTWVIPAAILLMVITAVIAFRVYPAHVRSSKDDHTNWSIKVVSKFVAGSYLGAIAGLAVANVLPLIVNSQLGASSNAYFYMAWVIGTNLELVAANFGISVVVQGAAHPEQITHLLRTAMKKQVLILGPAVLVLGLFAHPIFSFVFSRAYADSSSRLLQLLALGMIPKLSCILYGPATRLYGQVAAMATSQVSNSVLVLTLAWVGLNWRGLEGIGWGYLVAQIIMAVVLTPKVIKLLRGHMPESNVGDALRGNQCSGS